MLSIFPSLASKRPFGDQPLGKLRQDIDKIFDDFTGGFRFPATFYGDEETGLIPNIEVQEDDKQLTISTELPGIDEKDIDVSITDQLLTISGEKKHVSEKREGERFVTERAYGKFSRSLTLPFEIDEDKVDARYDKGVLTLTVPKPADVEKKTKRVKVQSG